jgi:diketogulonate reductase-like aldo/keto reductase
MCHTVVKVACYLLLLIVLLFASLIGWSATKEIPEGNMFATLIPLMQGSLPQTIFGSYVPPLTPPVPDDMMPLPRPTNEQFITLSGTGDQMPANGLGMCCRASAYDDESVRRSVLWYFLQGGRHIDTAHLYMNHKPIGVAIQQAIARGVPRSEMFIVTKIFDRAYSQGKEHIDQLLVQYAKDLQVDYIDLVLIHVPKAFVPISFFHPTMGVTGADWKEARINAWKALSGAKRRGIVRNIGVSNYDIGHLTELIELDIEPIACNQFMLSPFSPSFAFEIASFCQKHNIAVVAHSSLAGMEKDKALAHQTINAVKDQNSALKTSAQVLLKWAIQMGYAVIPGSGNPKHQLSNLNIYSATLSKKEMQTINSLRGDDTFMYMDLRDNKESSKEEM